MEENRKSFVFNVSWQEILLGYPAEVRLEVYDAIIRYVATGTLSELKPMAKMAFSFIKNEVDYNQKKYDDTIAKRSNAGKKGGGNPNFKKGDPNPYYKDKQTLSDINKDKQTLSDINKDKQTLSDINYNDNVNDNVYDNDNVNEREKEKEKVPPPEVQTSDFSLLPLDECKEAMKQNTQWIEVFCMNNQINDVNTLYSWIDKFFAQLQNEGTTTKQIRDATSHFARWYNLNKGKANEKTKADNGLKDMVLNRLKSKYGNN